MLAEVLAVLRTKRDSNEERQQRRGKNVSSNANRVTSKYHDGVMVSCHYVGTSRVGQCYSTHSAKVPAAPLEGLA